MFDIITPIIKPKQEGRLTNLSSLQKKQRPNLAPILMLASFSAPRLWAHSSHNKIFIQYFPLLQSDYKNNLRHYLYQFHRYHKRRLMSL
jgi:hypothetical protein